MLSLSVDIWRPVVSGGRAAPPIATNLAIWLRKGGASGATWTDSSSNGRTMTLNGSPTVGATSVTFNGSSQWGVVTGGVVNVFPGDYTLYMRVKPVAWTADAYVFSGQGGKASVAMKTATPTIACTDSLGTVQASTNMAVGAFSSMCAQFTAGSGAVLMRVNGGGAAIGTLVNTNVASSFTIGAKQGGASGWSNIEVVEVIGYTGLHSTPEIDQMIAYLGTL